MSFVEILFWSSFGLIIYVFIGYPACLWVIARLFPKPYEKDEAYQPMVTLIISAYNEEAIIREKIHNILALLYPKDKLEILIVSDASTDKTDAIVKEYQSQGIVLKRMLERGGKTVGLNAVLPGSIGEIIVFSDANALYDQNAIGKLVRNFKDPTIGCVTGDSLYVDLDESRVGLSEKKYWDYDRLLKANETKAGSMVGSDGAIFAIRKNLYTPLSPEDINDFILPLRIVAKRFRCVFEPEAYCEETATTYFEEEFRRKVRVVNRSWNGLWKVKKLLVPFKYGWFSFQLISHKLLRWLTPVFLIGMFGTSVFLYSQNKLYGMLMVGQLLFYSLGAIGFILEILRKENPWLTFPAYFLMVSVSSLIGICRSLLGERIVLWNPERKNQTQLQQKLNGSWLNLIFIILIGLFFLAAVKWPLAIFWSGMGLLIYTYCGYPILLMLLSFFGKKLWIKTEAYQPTFTLLIVAYNEADILEAKILNSLALEYPLEKLDIVVASDGSTDDTNSIISKYHNQGIRSYCAEVRMGKAELLNKVIPDLEKDIVLISDANVLYSKDVLQKLGRNFADPSIGVVSGEVRLVNLVAGFGTSEALYYRYEWFIKYLESVSESQIGADGAMYAFRRELFSLIPKNTVVDDLVLVMNIAIKGRRVVSDREAIGFEASPDSLYAEFHRHVRITAGGIQSFLAAEGVPNFTKPFLLFQYFSHKPLRWMTGLFMMVVAVSNFFLLDIFLYQIFAALQVVFYGLALIGVICTSVIVFIIPLYVCLVNAACFWGIIRGLFNLQVSQWEKVGRGNIKGVKPLLP